MTFLIQRLSSSARNIATDYFPPVMTPACSALKIAVAGKNSFEAKSNIY